MNEIKFRGMNKDTGQWVYGYYTKLVEGMRKFDAIISEIDHELVRYYIHSRKTIAQYIGLKGKNGVEIFEGDIIQWDDGSNGKYWRVAIVKINPDIQFECFDCPTIDNSSAHGHIFHFGSFIYTDTHNHIEVIGNIHESPELLK